MVTAATESSPLTDVDYTTMPLDLLIEKLVADHNLWREQVLPELGALLGKRTRQEKLGSVAALRHAFARMCQELEEHLRQEESILFPALLDMDRRSRQSQPRVREPFGSVRNPIQMIQREHEDDAEVWNTLQNLALLDATVKGAPEAARRLYQDLTLFADEVRTHTEIESKILFPRAVEMEQR